jgi:hypothetical protein
VCADVAGRWNLDAYLVGAAVERGARGLLGRAFDAALLEEDGSQDVLDVYEDILAMDTGGAVDRRALTSAGDGRHGVGDGWGAGDGRRGSAAAALSICATGLLGQRTLDGLSCATGRGPADGPPVMVRRVADDSLFGQRAAAAGKGPSGGQNDRNRKSVTSDSGSSTSSSTTQRRWWKRRGVVRRRGCQASMRKTGLSSAGL